VEVSLIFKRHQQYFIGLFALLCLLAATPVAAFAKGPGQTSSITYPIVKRDSLLNGLQFITLEKPSTGTVSLRVRIGSGSLFDLAGKGGLANLTAAMLLRGGGGLSAKNIEDTVEQSGLTVKLNVSWDATDIEISGPVDATDTMFDLLGRLVITPNFDQKEFDGLMAQRLEAMKAEGTSETEALRRKACEAVFGTHPFGRPAFGTVESLKQISRQDILYYHRKFYLANNALLIVSGDVTAETVTRLARSKLGAWKKGDKVEPLFRPPEVHQARRVLVFDRPESTASQAIIGQIGISRRAKDYFAAMVMSEILRAALNKAQADTFALDFEPRMVEGVMFLRVKPASGNLIAAIEQAQSLLTSLQAAAPTNEQVEAAKALLIARYAENLRSNPGEILFDVELYNLGRDYLITYADRVNLITPAEVHQAAQKYLRPQAVAIVIAGNAKAMESDLKKLGNVTITP
jgi:zinc protease